MATLISRLEGENQRYVREFQGLHSFYLTTLQSIFDVLINDPSYVQNFQVLNEQGRKVSADYDLNNEFDEYINACNEILGDSRKLDQYFSEPAWANYFSIGFRCVLSSLSPYNTYKIISGTSYLPTKTCKSLLSALSAQLSIIFLVTENFETQRIDSIYGLYGLCIHLEKTGYMFKSYHYLDSNFHQCNKITSINYTLDALFSCHTGNDDKLYSIGLRNYSLLNQNTLLYTKCCEKFTNYDKRCRNCNFLFALSGYDIFCKQNCTLCLNCRLINYNNCISCQRRYKDSEQRAIGEFYNSTHNR